MKKSAKSDILKVVRTVSFILTELMALTNPLTHLVYKVDSNLKFQRQWGEIFIYLAALLYFVLAFAVFRTSWKFISGKRKPAMVFLFILVAVGVFMQLLDKNLKVEVLFEAVGFTGVMLSVENEDDRIDFGMGFYNRAALNLDIGSSFRHNRKLSLIILKLNNYDLIDRLIGNDETNTIADIISGYLTSHVKRYHIYVSEKNTFVMTLYDKDKESILWGAEKSELGMVILENTIRMIQQMKKKILVEGVETVDHIKLLKKLQVDYLQGFYFSKPITKEEFIDFISDPLKKEFHIGSI